jgi:hypothetical protein
MEESEKHVLSGKSVHPSDNILFSIIVFVFLLLPAGAFSQNIDIRILRSIYSPEPLRSDKFFQFASNSDIFVVTGIPAGMAISQLP